MQTLCLKGMRYNCFAFEVKKPALQREGAGSHEHGVNHPLGEFIQGET